MYNQGKSHTGDQFNMVEFRSFTNESVASQSVDCTVYYDPTYGSVTHWSVGSLTFIVPFIYANFYVSESWLLNQPTEPTLIYDSVTTLRSHETLSLLVTPSQKLGEFPHSCREGLVTSDTQRALQTGAMKEPNSPYGLKWPSTTCKQLRHIWNACLILNLLKWN